MDVAIKTFKKLQYANKLMKTLSEIAVLCSVRHPNVLQLYGVVSEAPLSVVMELVSGGDLGRMLCRDRLALVTATVTVNDVSFNEGDIVTIEDELNEIKNENSAFDRSDRDGESTLLVHHDRYPNPIRVPMVHLRLFSAPLSDNEFSWSLRYRIALDIARGLRALHRNSPPIVHRDVRSPNVFIVSSDYRDPVVAKLADFGLAIPVLPPSGGELLTVTSLSLFLFLSISFPSPC